MSVHYATRLYWIKRGAEAQDVAESIISASGSSQLSTSAVSVVGPVWYSVKGTIGGATVKVQARQVVTATASATWQDIIGTTATTAIDKLIDFPPDSPNVVKAIVADASSTSDFAVRFQAGVGNDIFN